jgi:NitT/TauT family transport system permease protein
MFLKNQRTPMSESLSSKKVILPLIPLVLITGFFELAVRQNWIPQYLVPAPTQVAQNLFINSQELWLAALQTGMAAVVGFLASLLGGLVIGICLSTSRIVEKVFYPYAVFFQTVPIIAIAPLLVIWFGYGLPTVIASAFIVSIFPVIANTLNGFQSTDPALLDLFTLYGASQKDRLFKLKLPSALPQILTGARISSGLAVIGAIVGEFIGGGGLGGVVDEARTQQRIDQVFAAVLLASILGLVFFWSINILSRILLKNWHASEQTH